MHENESTLECHRNYHSNEREMAGHYCNCRVSSSSTSVQVHRVPPPSCQHCKHSELDPHKESASTYGKGWQCKIRHSHKLGVHLHTLRLFSRLILSFALLLSVCTVSHAHKLSWDSWLIDDTTYTDRHPGHNSALRVPDLVAVTGHLFQYQITAENSDSSIVHYQV